AGPVVCCAIVMPLDENEIIEGIDDSKKLTEKKREKLYGEILNKAISCSIYKIEPEEIDRINILQAVRQCMARAVLGLNGIAKTVLVDGNNTHLDEITGEEFNYEYLVKGDAKSYTIGCASIVAKVYRDRLMEEYSKEYKEYGFEKHKGYGTKIHIDTIKEIGPCPIHRRTFIKNFWEA
ncbi:MAG: ribonuclease HII, partial [Clostridia bacterium]|nr:ribonuclease HII [Clostridia bacterium]